jgi:hypothetical protein
MVAMKKASTPQAKRRSATEGVRSEMRMTATVMVPGLLRFFSV